MRETIKPPSTSEEETEALYARVMEELRKKDVSTQDYE